MGDGVGGGMYWKVGFVVAAQKMGVGVGGGMYWKVGYIVAQ
jgi:hypothetical protein